MIRLSNSGRTCKVAACTYTESIAFIKEVLLSPAWLGGGDSAAVPVSGVMVDEGITGGATALGVSTLHWCGSGWLRSFRYYYYYYVGHGPCSPVNASAMLYRMRGGSRREIVGAQSISGGDHLSGCQDKLQAAPALPDPSYDRAATIVRPVQRPNVSLRGPHQVTFVVTRYVV